MMLKRLYATLQNNDVKETYATLQNNDVKETVHDIAKQLC